MAPPPMPLLAVPIGIIQAIYKKNKMDPYPHPQHIKVVMYGVDVATISCGFEASTSAQWLHLAQSSDPGF
jgi:hypothetical protein